MKKNIRIISRVFMFVLCFSACKNKPSTPIKTDTIPDITYRQAAEFEETEAVWLLWSNYDHKQGYSNHAAQSDIIIALLPYVKIKLIVKNDSVINHILSGQTPLSNAAKKALENNQLSFIKQDYREFWARDMGPAFIIGSNKSLAIADFNFNGWGYGLPTDADIIKDEGLDERLAADLNLKMRSTPLITEGGDHEVNGKGIMLACEAVEKTRNPTMTLADIEAEFKRILGIQKIIWLKQGLHEDDYTFTGRLKNAKGDSLYTLLTTNGHVDETARFVNDSTILLAETSDNDPIDRENKRRMDINYTILQNSLDINGKHFTIKRMPLPKLMTTTMQPKDGVYDIIKDFDYKDGSTFPKGKPIKVIAAASYLNFLIANDVVLMAKYWKEGMDIDIKKRDLAAQKVLEDVFPNKKIIAIDAFPINLGGGGIHCITRNEPKIR